MAYFQASGEIETATRGKGLYDITDEITRFLAGLPVKGGMLTMFIRHTTASLVIQENADPDVLADLETFFAKFAPEGGPYRHQTEGPDDMPAHIRGAVLPTQLSIPIANGRLVLGTWQGIYVYEHRRAPHHRRIHLSVMGEA